jgi:hypothetical protein
MGGVAGALLALFVEPQPAAAATRAVVELGNGIEQWPEAARVRRLIQLELSDVDVPPPHDARSDSKYRGVFVRVLLLNGDLLVELWDRGELQGQSVMSARGEADLRARRIALVSAELARRLANRRAFAAERARRAALKEQQRVREKPAPVLRAAWSLGGHARAAMLLDNAWLFGPGVHSRLRFMNGPDLGIGVGALTGSAHGIEQAGTLQWFEVNLVSTYPVYASRKLGVALGADVGAATLHLSDVAYVDSPSNSESWSARAAALALLQWRLDRSSQLEFGTELGAMLRRVPLRTLEDTSAKLGGFWLGVRLGVDVSGI